MMINHPGAAVSIDEEDQDIDRLHGEAIEAFKKFQRRVTATQDRVHLVEEKAVEVQLELAAVKLAATKAEALFAEYQSRFSNVPTETKVEIVIEEAENEEAENEEIADEAETETETETAAVGASTRPIAITPEVKAVRARKVPVPAAKAVNGALVAAASSSARPSAKRRDEPKEPKEPKKVTVPERVAAAMGDGVWDAGSLAQVLADSGVEAFRSNSPRTYVSNILSTARIRVPLKDGKPLEVPRFTVLERGRYRVATPEDIQREVRKQRGSSEVIMSDNTTPADELFKEHGIDVRPAIDAGAA